MRALQRPCHPKPFQTSREPLVTQVQSLRLIAAGGAYSRRKIRSIPGSAGIIATVEPSSLRALKALYLQCADSCLS